MACGIPKPGMPGQEMWGCLPLGLLPLSPVPAEQDAVERDNEFWSRQRGFHRSSFICLLAAWLWADHFLNLSVFICKMGSKAFMRIKRQYPSSLVPKLLIPTASHPPPLLPLTDLVLRLLAGEGLWKWNSHLS